MEARNIYMKHMTLSVPLSSWPQEKILRRHLPQRLWKTTHFAPVDRSYYGCLRESSCRCSEEAGGGRWSIACSEGRSQVMEASVR